jgi:hypothetical protein
MNTRSRLISLLCLSLIVILLPGTALARSHVYHEYFTSRASCDSLHTTAQWDTVAGRLALPPFEAKLLSHLTFTSYVQEAAIAGDYAYLATWWDGLQVVDISDPEHPAVVGGWGTSGKGICVDGNYAFMGDWSSAVHVINIANPASPSLIKSVPMPGYVFDVAVAGDYVYVADIVGLVVVDVSDPANAFIAGSLALSNSAFGICVEGGYAYVANVDLGLKVIDISDPTNPSLVGTCGMTLAQDVFVAGRYAYVADAYAGLRVVDVADPKNPTVVATYPVPYAKGVVIEGDYAYVADDASGLYVLAVSDPLNPKAFDHYALFGGLRVAVDGNNAFLSGQNGFYVFRVSEPTRPTIVGGIGFSLFEFASNVAFSGNHAFVNAVYGGLIVLDISDPLHPTRSGSYDVSNYTMDLAVAGTYVYITHITNGLLVFNVSDPASPALVGTCDTPGDASDVAIAGNYAFIADGSGGFQVVDISDPASPTIAGSVGVPGSPIAVVVSGNYAYLACYAAGLQVIDISDPANPALETGVATGTVCWDVDISGAYLYAADEMYGVRVFDIRNPAAPSLVGGIYSGGDIYDVTVFGNYLFAAARYAGVHIFDISDPLHPSLFYTIPMGDNLTGVGVSGDYAYICDGPNGVSVAEVFQRKIGSSNNVGQSTVVDLTDYTITDVKLTTVQTDSIVWEASADSGMNWQKIPCDRAWHQLDHPGSGLEWQATLVYLGSGTNPSCEELQIDYQDDAATLLQSFNAVRRGLAIEVSWRLSEIDPGVTFSVWRLTEPEAEFARIPDAAIVDEGLSFAFEDGNVEPGTTYRYRIEYSNGPKSIVLFETAPVSIPALPLTLFQNYPNPFNPSTTIAFYLPERARVCLSIYDVRGSLMSTLVDRTYPRGHHSVRWDGTDANGRLAGSGIYFYRLRAGKSEIARKMILLR